MFPSPAAAAAASAGVGDASLALFVVVVVLLMWIESLNELANGSSDRVTLSFLDGPFHLELRRVLGGVHVSAVESRRTNVVVAEMNGELEGIQRTAQEAASQVIRRCDEMFWWSPDIDQLVTSTNNSLG